MNERDFTPTLGSELDILSREHAHVSASLIENRRKGATRFNVYILIVGAALAALGLKDGFAPPDGAEWSVIAAFAFLIVFGWIMLQTLIRRSITTDKHLEALQALRERCFRYHPDLESVIPSAGLPTGSRVGDVTLSFEHAKLRYYKTDGAASETPLKFFIYLTKQLLPRELLPHYGDLVENLCALNALIVSIGLLWLIGPPEGGTVAIVAVSAAFLASYIWLWHGQIMYVWYKHTFDLLLLRDDLGASRGADPVAEAKLQERDGEPRRFADEAERRYMHRLRRAMIEMSMLQAAVVTVAMGLVSEL